MKPKRPETDTSPEPETESASVVAVLQSALWQRLTETETDADLPAAWLALQCSMIEGASRAVVFVPTKTGLKPLASWPETASPDEDLAAAAELAAKEKRPLARGAGGGGKHPRVAFPIMVAGEAEAVVAVRMTLTGREPSTDELRSAIRQLQWGSAWIRDHMRRLRSAGDGQDLGRSRTTLDLIASVLEHERFAQAAMAAATDLAIRFDCARVSIGFVRRGSVRLAAISHTAQFGRQMSLVRRIGSAMDEAVDQRAVILFPSAPEDAVATQAHGELARFQTNGNILTTPIFSVDRFIGAITYERAKDQPFAPELIKLLDVMGAAIGPILEEKRRNDRWLAVKALESAGLQVKRLLGPGYIARKLSVAGLAALVAFFVFATDTYRVEADAEVEGTVRRAVVSAYDGYIREANSRAGEQVKAGDVLATLDDRELSLEKLRWATERQQYVFEYDRALAARQPATLNVIRSQIEQADAQIRLIDEQIARTSLVSPFDGLVVSGDLSQRIGGAVSRGETLFEITPLGGYRVVLQVDERQVADVEAGQQGEVVFTSLPDASFPLSVEKITPVARSRDGRNMFQVEATLDGASGRLRPGMIGVAKIAVEERPLIAIWMRPVIAWARLTAWRWIN